LTVHASGFIDQRSISIHEMKMTAVSVLNEVGHCCLLSFFQGKIIL